MINHAKELDPELASQMEAEKVIKPVSYDQRGTNYVDRHGRSYYSENFPVNDLSNDFRKLN